MLEVRKDVMWMRFSGFCVVVTVIDDVDVLEADLLAEHCFLLIEMPPAAVLFNVGNAVLRSKFLSRQTVSSDYALSDIVETDFGGDVIARSTLFVLDLINEGGFLE